MTHICEFSNPLLNVYTNGGMCISRCERRCYYRRRAEANDDPGTFRYKWFHRAMGLTMNSPGAGQQTTRRRASKTGTEDNITPFSSPHKVRKTHPPRIGFADP